MNKLLGSAPSLEMLLLGAKKFFCSDSISFVVESDGTYSVHNSKGRIDGVRVVAKKNRFRMETN